MARVVAGVVLCAGISLACGSRRAEANAAPVIAGIAISPDAVAPGGTVTVAANANDPDGDGLAYQWDVPAGWIVQGGGDGPALVLWAPPVPDATAAVVLTVSDPAGKRATQVALVHTATSAGVPAVTFQSVLAAPTPVTPGGTIAIAAAAASADGAAVGYRADADDPAWTVRADAAGARVTAPLAYGRSATISLTAVGATGGQAVARVLLSTAPWTAPTVDALVASPTATAPGGEVQLSAAARGADGLPVTYAWTVSGAGWTITPSSASAVVTAPAQPGAAATVTVTATDAAGASASSAVALSTSDAVPVLDAFAAEPVPVAPGGAVTAAAAAHGPAGAAVTYAWSVEPPGWSVTATGGTAAIRAPAAYDAVGVLTVTASDAWGSTTAHLLLSTTPYAPPVIASLVAAPAAVAPRGTAQLAVTASSPYGLPLSYAWSVDGTGWSVKGSGASAVLTAPATPGQAAIVVVDVRDAAGATTRGTVAVTTAVP